MRRCWKRNPAGVIVPDAGWCNPDDLWGIGVDGFSCPLPNPSVATPRWAAEVLESYGITLSTNPKTILCFNTVQEYTCWPTPLCEEMCYGWSINFRNTNSYRLFSSNVDALFQHLSDQAIEDIALAIQHIANANGLDGIRWHGIGDLVGRGIELDLITAMTDNPDFTVWGFTRKGNVLSKLPVRDNLVFWCSVDFSMDAHRLEIQVDAAEKHNTALAYATFIGEAYGSRTRAGKPMPPWEKPVLLKKPKTFYDPGPDEFLQGLMRGGYPISVVFGYHGSGRLTRVGHPDECPATDPLGGGHFLGTCLECGWCNRKHRGKETLEENRQKWVNADSFAGREFGEIWLDDGARRAV